LTLLVPNPAGAAESIGACIVEVIEENGGPEGVEAIVEAGEAEAEGEAHDALIELEDEMEAGCIEAPSLIIPEINEIIWGGLAFLVLLGLMIWKGFPLVRKTMEDRSEKIRTDLQAAQAARAEAEELKRQLEADLAESKANANRVLDQARQEAVVLGANLQVKAEADIAEMKQRAAADVAAARARALADLQSEVAEIVVGAAGKVVERNLDVNTHRQLIDDYIASVGRN
jgi:F-type H+-transporting ATPase subunit b